MNVGAAMVVLLGLVVGCGAMWFAWRLVRAAGGETAQAPSPAVSDDQAAGDEDAERVSADAGARAPSSALAQIGAVLAFGGICLCLPALINLAELWPLAAGGLITSLLGCAILLVRRTGRGRR